MPFSNVPEHLQDKMERCVQKVTGEGKEKEAAIAICHDSVVGKGPLALSMTITKAERMSDGRIRWRARANTGEVDLENERFDKSFWGDIVGNFFLVAEATSKGLRTPRGLPTPILDISHYSHTLPADKRNLARAGWPTKLWPDGKALMAQGYFDNTPLGAFASKAALNRKPEDRRVSICVYPDWGRVDVDVETGVRTFKGGAGNAHLDHLAMTANPIDPGAQLELEDTMAKGLQVKDDALQVLGEDAKELIDELEEARKASKSQVVDDGAIIKADALKSEGTMEDKKKADAEPAKDTTTDKKPEDTTEEETQEEETTQEPATLSAAQIGPVVADELTKALPKIGEAINQRIEPLQKAIEALKGEIDVLKTSETEKLVAALKSDGDWVEGMYKEMFGNSVQRVKGDTVKGEAKGAGPQEALGEYATRYGNPE